MKTGKQAVIYGQIPDPTDIHLATLTTYLTQVYNNCHLSDDQENDRINAVEALRTVLKENDFTTGM